MSEHRVRVADLTEVCTTRRKGEALYGAVIEKIRDGRHPVVVSFDGVRCLMVPFLFASIGRLRRELGTSFDAKVVVEVPDGSDRSLIDLAIEHAARCGAGAIDLPVDLGAGEGDRGSENHEDDFTRDLTELCLKYGVGLEGAVVFAIDMTWDGPDSDKHARYAIACDGRLIRTF